MEMTQFMPARAKKKLASEHELDNVRGFLTEQKIDGQRYLIQTRPDGHTNCTSRRISTTTQRFVEKGDRVPHICKVNLPPYTIIDCEFASPEDIVLLDIPGKFWDKAHQHPHLDWLMNKYDGAMPVYPHVSQTTSIMGSLAPEAIRKQKETGNIWAYAFDLIHYNKQSVVHNTQMKRRLFLARLLESVDPESGVVLMPQFIGLTPDEQFELFELIADIKGEGLIFKDPEKQYNHARAWWKWKKDYPADVVLTGNYTPGTGKLSGYAGSVEIGVYVGDKIFPVGYVSAIMDSEAKVPELTENLPDLIGTPIEIRHNGLQKVDTFLGFSLRHPRFRRWRTDDKNPEECTAQALKEGV